MANTPILTRRAVIAAPLALAACKGGVPVIELAGTTMGTTYSVTALDPEGRTDRATAAAAVETALAQVNAELSNWDATSEVSRFNRATGTQAMPVSAGLAEVVTAAAQVHAASGGQFDITLAPLIDLWGFGPDARPAQIPTEAQIAAALDTGGQGDALALSPAGLRKTRADVSVQVAGLGKGHGVDRVARALEGLGLTEYMVEIGGDLYAAGGNREGIDWQIGIEVPDATTRRAHSVLGVSGFGLATSGDYRNYFERDGVRYSHILDAQSGRPVTHRTASATVLADTAMLADAWSTAMLVLGRDRGMELARAYDLAVMFIDRDPTRADAFVAASSPRMMALQA